ncbi:MAG: hypothetical protein ACT4PT_13230 [Methanobacteriota archaeon]
MEAAQTIATRVRDEKEIKVKIPVDYHIKLHTLKVLRGQNISETVEIALGKYFSALNQDFGEKGYEGLLQDRMSFF